MRLVFSNGREDRADPLCLSLAQLVYSDVVADPSNPF